MFRGKSKAIQPNNKIINLGRLEVSNRSPAVKNVNNMDYLLDLSSALYTTVFL